MIAQRISKVWHQIVLRNFLLRIMQPSLKILAKLPTIGFKKEFPESVFFAMEKAPMGAIVLSRSISPISNLLVPGYWSHCAIVAGNGGYMFEANATKGVIAKTVSEFLLDKKEIAICILPDTEKEFEELGVDIVSEDNGKPYDWYFERDNTKFYCAELCAKYINERLPFMMKPKIYMGVETFLPDQFAQTPFVQIMRSI
ncbi:MAG: YiiX/YebB-like N1pC/P60 family cysteine hydrolase [Alphaproteobacteria bacterium]